VFKHIKIRIGKTNTYLFQSEFGFYILLDTAIISGGHKLIDRLIKIGIKPHDLKLIIITHSHYDHTGSLAAIKKWSNAKVIAHSKAKILLKTGKTAQPMSCDPVLRRIINQISRCYPSLSKVPPVDIDIEITKVFDLSDWGIKGYIIPTPGHTSDSLSLILDDHSAYVGDTMFNITPFSINPPFQEDHEALRDSWLTLSETNSSHFFPGHGSEIKRDRFLKSLKKASK
jgi:hydroxyacylglutathione hydrolase